MAAAEVPPIDVAIVGAGLCGLARAACTGAVEAAGVHAGTRRVAGGSARLVEALSGALPAESVLTGYALRLLRDRGAWFELHLAHEGRASGRAGRLRGAGRIAARTSNAGCRCRSRASWCSCTARKRQRQGRCSG
ncbi:hypothetical protein [Paraburkholderia lycopersici]|uniref:hypothetical protein n=1 Tax=Paraburkholderia lycopersici TaxID=416944 RepID=UPI0015A07BFF|nr:hypothetical protein [Paraburkholderia lycopersici]